MLRRRKNISTDDSTSFVIFCGIPYSTVWRMIMKRWALALLICLAFACVSYAQDSGESGAPSEPVKVKGNVINGTLIHKVLPKYPKDAKKAGVSGTVVVKAIVRKDGSMRDVEYVSGPEQLADAAVKAVQKWRYTPTLFNGEPVEVETTISVVFTLGGH
jgi:TonB family protein